MEETEDGGFIRNENSGLRKSELCPLCAFVAHRVSRDCKGGPGPLSALISRDTIL